MTALNCSVHEIPSTDGYVLKTRVFEPDKPCAGTIICLHGIQSHSGWYTESSKRLANAGYRVIFPDRRGSGLNEKARGDVTSWRQLITDIEAVHAYFGSPSTVDILAISWGAKLAFLMCAGNYPWISRIVLITPGILPRLDYGFTKKMFVLKNLIFNKGRKFMPIPIPGPEYFSKHKKWQDYIANDKPTLTHCTARFFLNTSKIDRQIAKIKNPFLIPAFLLLAQNDRIIYNDRTIDFFRKYFVNEKSVIKEYSDCEHTLEFDDDNFTFADDILRFLQ